MLGALALALMPLHVQAQQYVPSQAENARTLTLEQAVALALEHNRDLADARLGLKSARGQVREA